MNPYIVGGVAIAAFGAGFMVNGWRLNAEIESIHAAHAVAVAKATAEAMDQTVELQGKKDDALKEAQKQPRLTLLLPIVLVLSLTGCGTTTVAPPMKSLVLPAPPLESTPQPQQPYSQSAAQLLQTWRERLTATPLTQKP